MHTPTGPMGPSDKSRTVALALSVILGVFGAHRFYVGKIGTGFLMLVTLGGLGIWWLADLIMLITGQFRDKDGRRVTEFARGDVLARERAVRSPRREAHQGRPFRR